MISWLWNNWTWLVPLVAFSVVVLGTWSIWWPWWQLLPTPVKTAIVGGVAALVFYRAGQSSGAATANEKAQAKDQANADKIETAGNEARAAVRRRIERDGVRQSDSDERKGRQGGV